MGISFTDEATGITWLQELCAAELQTERHHGALPGKLGTFDMVQVDPRGLKFADPLLEAYPDVQRLHYAAVVPERYIVRQGKAWGVCFYENWNGSGPSSTVRSEFGVSDLAPISWQFDPRYPDALDNPKAKPYIEHRILQISGQMLAWSNARGHGFMGPGGVRGDWSRLDWSDGRNDDPVTMWDPARAQVFQSIVVPKYLQLGTSHQQVPPDAWTNTLATLVYMPRPEYADAARKIAQLPRLLTYDEARMSFGGRGGAVSKSRGDAATIAYDITRDLNEAAGAKDLDRFEITNGDQPINQFAIPSFLPNQWLVLRAIVYEWFASEDQRDALPIMSARQDTRRRFGEVRGPVDVMGPDSA